LQSIDDQSVFFVEVHGIPSELLPSDEFKVLRPTIDASPWRADPQGLS
jgi:hypothetical protein